MLLSIAVAVMVWAVFGMAGPARAQNDRIIDTPAGWGYLYGANSTEIAAQESAGFRPFSLERVGTGLYDVVLVHNSGPYAVTGATVTYGRTGASMETYLNANGRRLLDLEVYDSGGSTFMSALTVPNSGPTGTPAWGWLYNVSFSEIAAWLTNNPSLRLIDLDVYTIGGTQYYSAVAVHNSGNNAQGWWWYGGITATQVTQELENNDARLVALEISSPGSIGNPTRYSCVMVSSNPGGGWWYPALTTAQVSSLLAQNGARLTCLKRYTNFIGESRWAVVMVDNANAQTRRMREYMDASVTQGSYGFMLKQVGGPVLASLNENFAFEPASMLKILHSTYAIRQCSLGLDNLTTNVFVRDRCNPNECPDNVQCNAGNETLSEVIRRTMENSDNNRTWELETRYGRTALNNFATSRGLGNTRINHRLGCLCGEPFNSFSCVDAVNLYEQIADGSLFSEAWRDELFSRMLDLENQGYGIYPTLNNIITQEAAATNLTSAEIAQFRAAVRFANKGGGYACGSERWRTEGGWASIPFKVQILGNYITLNREYVMATFVHGGTDPGANIAYNAKEEILREQIRAALQSWDDACTPPAIIPQPVNRTAVVGGSATFSSGSLGTASGRTFRWQRRNANGTWSNLSDIAGRISGATTGSLTISNIVSGDAGSYRLVVTNGCGTATSNAATLTVNTPACAGDWNEDGTANSADISAFLTSWIASVNNGTLVADFNGDLVVNSGDISAFLSAWIAAVSGGC